MGGKLESHTLKKNGEIVVCIAIFCATRNDIKMSCHQTPSKANPAIPNKKHELENILLQCLFLPIDCREDNTLRLKLRKICIYIDQYIF